MKSEPPVLWYTWVFGNEDYHAEAMGLLLSSFVHKSERSRFRVYTDRPEWYAWLGSMVEVMSMPKEEVMECAGERLYLPRTKAKLIGSVAAGFEGHTVWLDTDMWATEDLAPLENMLDSNQPLMHLREGKISAGATTTERRYRAYFSRKTPALLPALYQWNSGVVGLPKGWATCADSAIKILDDMTAHGILDFTREQMAFSSVLLGKTELMPAEPYFRHYYGGKRARWQPLLKRLVFQIAVNREKPGVILEWIKALPSASIPARRQSWIERKKRSLRKHLGLLAPNE